MYFHSQLIALIARSPEYPSPLFDEMSLGLVYKEQQGEVIGYQESGPSWIP